jgi:4-hydroxybenzoyl-CoA thioesterase
MNNTQASSPGMPFVTETLVRFGDCDPAGIVFYPRYFEMINNVVEDWCANGLHMSLRELIMERGLGLPTVHIETDFVAPSKLGDVLRAELLVEKLGGASINLAIRLSAQDGGERVRTRLVLVLMDGKKMCAIPIPDSLRAGIARYCMDQQ